jgi:hypothetical protein
MLSLMVARANPCSTCGSAEISTEVQTLRNAPYSNGRVVACDIEAPALAMRIMAISTFLSRLA